MAPEQRKRWDHAMRFTLLVLVIVVPLMLISRVSALDIEHLRDYMQKAAAALEAKDYERVRELTTDYLQSDDFHAHVGLSIATNLSKVDELLDLAAEVVQQSIDENTPEHLALMAPAMGTERHQALEYGRLYSLQAWIAWKRGDSSVAVASITRATDLLEQAGGVTGTDLLRSGIIRFGTGEKEEGWSAIEKAFLADSGVEDSDPSFPGVLSAILRERGSTQTLAEFLRSHRLQNAPLLPGAQILVGGKTTTLAELARKATFINFFSPSCGSCRQEISSLSSIYGELSSDEDVSFLFVLNQPDLRHQAEQMLKDAGLEDALLLTVKNGSAYDLIDAEPAIWFAGPDGRVLAKYTGYSPGDELKYERELLRLLAE